MRHSFVAICLSILALSTALAQRNRPVPVPRNATVLCKNDLEAVSGCFGYLIAN